jgi:hypothetical protein
MSLILNFMPLLVTIYSMHYFHLECLLLPVLHFKILPNFQDSTSVMYSCFPQSQVNRLFKFQILISDKILSLFSDNYLSQFSACLFSPLIYEFFEEVIRT